MGERNDSKAVAYLRRSRVDGAEAFSGENFDRGLTTKELARIIRRYEGQ